MSTTRAAIYLRQSLDRTGQGLAVERQRAACRKLAKSRGWKVVREYCDNDVSASSRKPRPQYTEMLDDAADGQFDRIVVWAVDRLTRKVTELEQLIELAETTGVAVATVSGDIDLATDSGRLVGRILASVARGEMERKSSRQVLAARQRAESGQPNGRAFGYNADGTEIVEAEAVLVREMYTRLLAGDTLVGLARFMDTTGMPTSHGGRWHRETLRRQLMSARYAGIGTYKGTEVGPGKFPAIVDEATFRAAVAILSDPKRVKNQIGGARKWLGSGLYVCGACELPVRTTGRTVDSSYICPDGHTHRSRAGVDKEVIGAIVTRLRGSHVVDMLVHEHVDRAEPLRAEAAALRLRLEHAADDYAAGLLDGSQVHRASAKIRDRIGEIEAELAELGRANGLGLVLAAADPAEAFTNAPLGVQRAVVAALATVRLDRGAPGRNFDPSTVRIEWRVV